MAGQFQELFKQSFDGDSLFIDIQHGLSRNYHNFKIIDSSGIPRQDLIDVILVDEVDPLNRFIVVLTTTGISGSVQLLSSDVDNVHSTGSSGNVQNRLGNSGLFTTRPHYNNNPLLAHGEAVRELNGLSGVVTIGSGVSNIIQVDTSEASGITLDLDISLLEQTLSLSGIAKQEVAASEDFASTTSTSYVQALSLGWNVVTSGTYRAQWSFQGGCSQANKVCKFRIQLDDSALLSDFMDMTTSFNVGGTGNGLQFGGFRQFGAAAGAHTLDFDFQFADTGGAACQIANLRLEILRVV